MSARRAFLLLPLALLAAAGCSPDKPAAEATPPAAPAASATEATPAAAQTKTQETCPVMGGKVDPAIFVDHAGKRIYLCCQGCVAAVTADPEKYIRQLEAAGVVLAPTPDRAP